MPGPVLGTALSVGGNLIGAAAGAAAARRRNAMLAEGGREQNRAGMETAGTMADFISQLRSSSPNPAAERGAFTAAMAGAPGISGPITAGPRFRTDAARATGAARGYGNQLADLFSRIRAPGLQRQNESELMARMSDALRPIALRSQDDAFLTNLRSGMVKPNPWAGMVGDAASRAGNYLIEAG